MFVTIHSSAMIGLATSKSVKPSYYLTRGRRPRVDDMVVSHDEQLLNILVQRRIKHFSVIRTRDHLYRSRDILSVDWVSLGLALIRPMIGY